MTDYTDVTVTVGSSAELQMQMQGLRAKYPDLDPKRLRIRELTPGQFQIYVAEEDR